MRNNIVNNMRLDLDHERTRPRISVRQGDTKTRSLHFTLMQSGKIYDLSDVLVAAVSIVKPDGKVCYNDCVIDGSEIQYEVTTQTINVLGECIGQIELSMQDGAVITSPEFVIYVYNTRSWTRISLNLRMNTNHWCSRLLRQKTIATRQNSTRHFRRTQRGIYLLWKADLPRKQQLSRSIRMRYQVCRKH